jgi:hypothetical protein
MKILLSILLFSLSLSSFAKTVARVLEVKGNAFVFYGKKDSRKLFYADKIEEMSEIMVDDSSSVSIKDEYGRVFHLAGGTYVKVFNNLVELKNGNVWVSSDKKTNFGVINTVNAIAKYTTGQFIYSFDNVSGKTQVLVMTGKVNYSNIVESNLSVEIPAGHFSFVDQSLANGLPRGATRIGLSSYKKVKSLFNGIESLEKTSFDKAFVNESPSMKRSIASVPSSDSSTGKKGKLIYVGGDLVSRKVASVTKEVSAYDYYKEAKKKYNFSKVKKVAPVRMFGFSPSVAAPKVVAKKHTAVKKQNNPVVKKVQKKSVKRLPASVETQSLISEINSSGAFETSLQKATKSNKRHPEEVNKLINELKSYEQTYQDDY